MRDGSQGVLHVAPVPQLADTRFTTLTDDGDTQSVYMIHRWQLFAQLLSEVMGKESQCALAETEAYPASEVTAMLRELGMALVEVEQPTQVVAARLMAVAR